MRLRGIVRNVNQWRTIDIATASFGQGVAVTSLQLVRAYAALANGGMLVDPTILYSERPKSSRRVLSEKTAETIKGMIRGVIHDEQGTARRAKIAGISVYGKTGTAQKADPNGRGYLPDSVLSSFIGFVDGSEVGISKKLVMLVVVDEPMVRPRWGGRVAAPIFRRSMERILSHLLSSGGALRTASITARDSKIG